MEKFGMADVARFEAIGPAEILDASA